MALRCEPERELAALAELDKAIGKLRSKRKLVELSVRALSELYAQQQKAEAKAALAAAHNSVKSEPAEGTESSSSDSGSDSDSESDAPAAAAPAADPPVPAASAPSVSSASHVQLAAALVQACAPPDAPAVPPQVKAEGGDEPEPAETNVQVAPNPAKRRCRYPPNVCRVCWTAANGMEKVRGQSHLRTCPMASSHGGNRRA